MAVYSGGVAAGAFASADNGVAMIDNSGSIAVSAYGSAYGALALGGYGAVVHNEGVIHAEATPAGTAIGVRATAYGDVLVENSGSISASNPESGRASCRERVCQYV